MMANQKWRSNKGVSFFNGSLSLKIWVRYFLDLMIVIPFEYVLIHTKLQLKNNFFLIASTFKRISVVFKGISVIFKGISVIFKESPLFSASVPFYLKDSPKFA